MKKLIFSVNFLDRISVVTIAVVAVDVIIISKLLFASPSSGPIFYTDLTLNIANITYEINLQYDYIF